MGNQNSSLSSSTGPTENTGTTSASEKAIPNGKPVEKFGSNLPETTIKDANVHDDNEKNALKELDISGPSGVSNDGPNGFTPKNDEYFIKGHDQETFIFVVHRQTQSDEDEDEAKRRIAKEVGKKALIYGGAAAGTAAVVGGIAFVILNVAVPVVGFTSAGIAAGSYAAGMMSSAAIANGGGVAAGSAVAILQSIGATGVAASTCAAGGAGVAAAGTGVAGIGEAMYTLSKSGDPVEAAPQNVRYVKRKRLVRDQGTQTESDSNEGK